MKREIVKDPLLLSRPCSEATKEDIQTAWDLLDTLAFHKDHCVGMAANMIGVTKRIIVFLDETTYVVMLNPVVLKTSGNRYEAREGCLCHEGTKAVQRYACIKVSYQDLEMKKRIKTFRGFSAQIIQHELDHCEGVLI